MAIERSAKSGRVLYVDLLRLVMTFQMVQGHSIDAILDEGARGGPVYDGWSWIRGLTSVGFLFAAGVSFHLATLTRFDRHKADPEAVRHRFARGAQLVVIGYLLHFPLGALSGDPEAARVALAAFTIVDVLQCIGVSIVVLEVFTVLCRRAWHVTALAGVLSIACIALAPVFADVSPSGALTPLSNYVTARGGSIFPLLPWAGYLFAGVLCGAVASPAPGRSSEGRSALVLLAVGASVTALGWLVDPGVEKLGVVVLVASAFAGLGAAGVRVGGSFEILASETLVIYVVHIVVLYGTPFGLSHVVGPVVSPVGAATVAAAMVAASAAVGLAWHRAKVVRRRRPRVPA